MTAEPDILQLLVLSLAGPTQSPLAVAQSTLKLGFSADFHFHFHWLSPKQLASLQFPTGVWSESEIGCLRCTFEEGFSKRCLCENPDQSLQHVNNDSSSMREKQERSRHHIDIEKERKSSLLHITLLEFYAAEDFVRNQWCNFSHERSRREEGWYMQSVNILLVKER